MRCPSRVTASTAPVPGDSSEFIALPSFARGGLAADVEGRGSGPRGLRMLVVRSTVSLGLLQGR